MPEVRADDGDTREPQAKRMRYEPPVLRHLGSVNRLTLALSTGNVSDFSRFKAKP